MVSYKIVSTPALVLGRIDEGTVETFLGFVDAYQWDEAESFYNRNIALLGVRFFGLTEGETMSMVSYLRDTRDVMQNVCNAMPIGTVRDQLDRDISALNCLIVTMDHAMVPYLYLFEDALEKMRVCPEPMTSTYLDGLLEAET